MWPLLKYLTIFMLTNCAFIDFVVVVKGLANITDVFEKNGVVPDVVEIAPKALLKMKYGSSEVDPGMVLTPTQVKDAPDVSWDGTPDQYYTMMMVDPDAPSRANPKYRSWQHWLVANIPGDNLTAGDTLSAYVGAGPGKGSGHHRYVSLVFKQEALMRFYEETLNDTSTYKRPGFSVTNFTQRYNLSSPIAGNFFQTEYDEYVPKLYQQLGIANGLNSGCDPLNIGLALLPFIMCFYM